MKDTSAPNRIAAVPDNRRPGNYPERRAHARHSFSALAEVIETRTRARLTCRATDLSFGGIYVDTISPFAPGSSVMVRLSCEGRSLQIGARVTYALDGMGMGLAFVPDLPPEQADALHSWIAELSGDVYAASAMNFDSPIPVPNFSQRSSTTNDFERLREGTRDLVEILLRKQILTESEASSLRSKLR